MKLSTNVGVIVGVKAVKEPSKSIWLEFDRILRGVRLTPDEAREVIKMLRAELTVLGESEDA